MKKGSRFLLGSVVLTLVAAASIPWWIGREVERQFDAQFEQLRQQLQMQPEVELVLESYRQGFLSSTAVTALTIAGTRLVSGEDSAPPAPVRVVVAHQISHGPYIDGKFRRDVAARIVSVVTPDSEQQRTLMQFYFRDRSPFKMTTELKWSGEMASYGGIPAYSGRDHSGEYELRWGGLRFESEGDWIAMRGDGEFNAPRFEFTNSSLGITVGGVTGRFRSFMSPQGFALGDGELSLASIKLRGGDLRQMVLRDLSAKYDAKQQNGLVNLTQRLGFRLLQIDNSEYRAGVLQFEFNNLDAVVLQSLRRRYETLAVSGPAGEAALWPWWRAEMQQVLPALLPRAPALHINRAEVTTVDGQVSARLKLASDRAPSDIRRIDMRSGVAALLPFLRLELDLRLPAKTIERQARSVAREKIVAQLVEQAQTVTASELARQTRRAAEQMLVQFEIQNIIQRQPGYYTTKLRFKNGRLLLNGVPADNFLNMLPPLQGS